MLPMLTMVGPTCCGSADQTRCLSSSNMCKIDSDLQSAATIDGETCTDWSTYLLTYFNASYWHDGLCDLVPMISLNPLEPPSTPPSMSQSLSHYGPTCCGSAAQTRCLNFTMCKIDSDFQSSETMDGDTMTC